MSRTLALLGVLLALQGCRSDAWGAPRSLAAPFLVPGATEIRVASLGSHTWQISYRAPGVPSTWYAAVVQQLEQDQWRSPDRAEYGPLNRTYMRASSVGIGDVWEWVFVRLDPMKPEVAQITLRRVVVFPWWRRLSRMLSAS